MSQPPSPHAPTKAGSNPPPFDPMVALFSDAAQKAASELVTSFRTELQIEALRLALKNRKKDGSGLQATADDVQQAQKNLMPPAVKSQVWISKALVAVGPTLAAVAGGLLAVDFTKWHWGWSPAIVVIGIVMTIVGCYLRRAKTAE